MDRLSEMETFVKVVESGGIGAAAERMDVAKSAVSRRLKELETKLGVRLLNRTTRRISVTESGRSYYDRCLGILADIREAEEAATDVHGTLRGTLRIAAPNSFGRLHLADAVTQFLHAVGRHRTERPSGRPCRRRIRHGGARRCPAGFEPHRAQAGDRACRVLHLAGVSEETRHAEDAAGSPGA